MKPFYTDTAPIENPTGRTGRFETTCLGFLAAGYQAQIVALTHPSLSRTERIKLFCAAAQFPERVTKSVLLTDAQFQSSGVSVARTLWAYPMPSSLFGVVPGTANKCPTLMACAHDPRASKVIPIVPEDWHPTAGELQEFVNIHLQARSSAA